MASLFHCPVPRVLLGLSAAVFLGWYSYQDVLQELLSDPRLATRQPCTFSGHCVRRQVATGTGEA
jgi:hypothetical protein